MKSFIIRIAVVLSYFITLASSIVWAEEFQATPPKGMESKNKDFDRSSISIEESFVLSEDNNTQTYYSIRTEYQGNEADFKRQQLESQDLDSIEGSYLNFHRDYYHDIETLLDIKIYDNDPSGRMLIKERYQIPSIWREEEERLSTRFYANALMEYIRIPDEAGRASPLKIIYPKNIEQVIEVRLPDAGWEFDDESQVEDNTYFQFKYDVVFNQSENILMLTYAYKSKMDAVPAEGVESFLAALDRVSELTDYGIYMDLEMDDGLMTVTEKEFMIWIWVLCLSVFSIVFAFVNLYLESKGNPRKKGKFFPVAKTKLIVLSIFTYGLYITYWFYRNWSYVKVTDNLVRPNSNHSIPWGRAIFSLFWYYPLYKRVFDHDQQSNEFNRGINLIWGAFFAVGYLAIYIVPELLGGRVSMLAFLSFIFLIPIVSYVNTLPSNNEPLKANSRWRLRHVLLCVSMFPVIALIYGSEFGLLPGSKVVPADKLWVHNIRAMENKGVFASEEKLAYFYSDSSMNFGAHGVGFTDKTVFSYEYYGGELFIEKESISDV